MPNNIATNAARIGYSIDWGLDFTPALVEEVVSAAIALDAFETKPGFDWEDQPLDWEIVCARLADEIAEGHPPARVLNDIGTCNRHDLPSHGQNVLFPLEPVGFGGRDLTRLD